MYSGHLKIVVALGFLVLLVVLGRGAFSKPDSAESRPSKGPDSGLNPDGPWKNFKKPTAAELKTKLNAIQYGVTQEEGTEPAFRNEFWDNHRDGIYVDVVSGEPLFSSIDKFESGTGWPSFMRPLVADNVTLKEDTSLGMRRVEARSTHGDSHLGHLFNDGPAPTGLRYCINSAALRFIPVDALEDEGYGDLLVLFRPDEANKAGKPERTETATLAGGCFWGMEDILREIPGVLDTQVGYTGGHVADASYQDVKTGKSGHAESVQIVFDPDRVSYEDILMFFFRMHDPTTPNRQGNDRGTQYRSAIFVHDDAQRKIAEQVKDEVDAAGRWERPIVTEIVDAGPFYPAEEYHQDYLEKHPNGYTCHYLRDWD